MAGTQRMTKVVLEDLVANKGLPRDVASALATNLERAEALADEERASGERSIPPEVAALDAELAETKAALANELEAPRFEDVLVPDDLVAAEEARPEDAVPAIAQELPLDAPFEGFGETEEEAPAPNAVATARMRRITTPTEPAESVIIDESVTLAAAVAAHNARAAAAKAKSDPPARAPAPSSPDALKTKLARKFTSFADDLNERLVDFRIGAAWWSVELTAPEGMSTAGGKQALQHLRLRPRRPGFTDFVGGSVDAGGKYAELRDYEYVCIVHALRFANQPLALSEAEWEQLLRRLEVELAGMEVATHRVSAPKEVRAERARLKRVPTAAIAAFAVITLLALLVVWRVLASL